MLQRACEACRTRGEVGRVRQGGGVGRTPFYPRSHAKGRGVRLLCPRRTRRGAEYGGQQFVRVVRRLVGVDVCQDGILLLHSANPLRATAVLQRERKCLRRSLSAKSRIDWL